MPNAAATSEGADLLQIGLIAGAAIFVFLHGLHGWQLGLPRALARIAAIGAAYGAGIWAAPLAPAALRPVLKLPDFALAAVGGAVFGLLAYLAVILLSGLLFKKTRDQRSLLARVVFGGMGAVVGAATGLLFLWFMIIAVRVLGTIAQSQLPSAALVEGREIPESGELEPFSGGAPETPAGGEARSPVVIGLARLKESLDKGLVGSISEAVDPIPEEAYRIMEKIGRLVSDAAAMRRFMDYPGAGELAAHPKIRALAANREIARLAERRDFQTLLGSDLVISTANDPEVARLIKAFPIEKALDFALGIPRSDAPPRPPAPVEL